MMRRPLLTPEEAGKAFKEIPAGYRTVVELARRLKEQNTPISAGTLNKWRKQKWKSGPPPVKVKRTKEQVTFDEIELAMRRCGITRKVIRDLDSKLETSERYEVIEQTAALIFRNTAMILVEARAQAEILLHKNPGGLAAVVSACANALRSGQEMVEQSVVLAERMMRSKTLDPVAPQQITSASDALVSTELPYADLLAEFGVYAMPEGHDTKAEIVVKNGKGHTNGSNGADS